MTHKTSDMKAYKREWIRAKRAVDPDYGVDKAKRSDTKKRYYADNKDKVLHATYENRLRRDFGITLAEYDAMFEAQDGLCAICQQPETCTYKGTLKRLAVDHCHTTGQVRGLLCRQCNTALGSFGDDVELLMRAINYLEGFDG